MSSPLKKQLQALPTYFGSKRRLLAWLNSTLVKALSPEHWKQATFIDLFMGGGAVSVWAKAQGFKQVIANDISNRSQILAQAFLTNTQVQITAQDALWLTQALPEEQKPGFIETQYCPSVFARRHAQALEQGFYWANAYPDPIKQALLKTLMWHLANEFVAFSTSMGTSNRPFAEALDGLREWDSLNPKRFTDGSLARLCEPTWARLEEKRKLINQGVLGGSPVTVYKADALTVLPKLTGDILYLDPPYAGTVSYERGNQVLDALLQGQAKSHSVEVSAFSKSTDILSSLLAQAQHIPIWLLSYGNQALSLEALMELVKHQAHGREVVGFAKRYRHLSHVSQNKNNQELLILAYPKETQV